MKTYVTFSIAICNFGRWVTLRMWTIQMDQIKVGDRISISFQLELRKVWRKTHYKADIIDNTEKKMHFKWENSVSVMMTKVTFWFIVCTNHHQKKNILDCSYGYHYERQVASSQQKCIDELEEFEITAFQLQGKKNGSKHRFDNVPNEFLRGIIS